MNTEDNIIEYISIEEEIHGYKIDKEILLKQIADIMSSPHIPVGIKNDIERGYEDELKELNKKIQKLELIE